MPVSAKYDFEHDLVETNFTGTVTMDDLEEEIELTLELIEKHGCTRILSDFSISNVDQLSVVDVSQTPEMQESAGSSRIYRIAVIPPDSEAGRELARFYELVCSNRGWPAKACSTRQEAIDWLMST